MESFITLDKEIEVGDTVEYIDTKFNKETRKNSKVAIHGIWNGKKVVCTDKEMTTVYKKEWLKPGILLDILE